MNMRKINGNDMVRVQLHDEGKRELERLHEIEMDKLRDGGCWVDAGPAYELDSDGYWRVQLWELMNKLGPLCVHGRDPFNMHMLLELAQ